MDTIVCGRGWLNKASDAGTGRGVVGISNHKGTKTQTFSICVLGASINDAASGYLDGVLQFHTLTRTIVGVPSDRQPQPAKDLCLPSPQ